MNGTMYAVDVELCLTNLCLKLESSMLNALTSATDHSRSLACQQANILLSLVSAYGYILADVIQETPATAPERARAGKSSAHQSFRAGSCSSLLRQSQMDGQPHQNIRSLQLQHPMLYPMQVSTRCSPMGLGCPARMLHEACPITTGCF